MPLPCKSTKDKDWVYRKLCDIPYLKDRKTYLKEIRPERIKLFTEIIGEHNPETVIFYSFTNLYFDSWKKIINGKFKEDNNIYFCNTAKTKYFVIPHPNKRGLTNEDWNHIAKKIQKKIKMPVQRP
jgi:hypothetical protein